MKNGQVSEKIDSKFSNILGKIELTISGLFILIACSLIFASVLLREISGYSSSIFEELVRYLIVWSVFIGASWALKKDKHITINILLHNVPKRVAKMLQLISFCIGFVFCILLIYYGMKLVIHSYQLNEMSMSVWRFPMYIPKLAVPLGSLLISLRFLEKIVEYISHLRKGDVV